MGALEQRQREASITVLHVDDEPEFAKLSTQFLTGEADDLEVLTEHTARDGLARIEAAPIDCVVSDYDMPGPDGLSFLAEIRERHPELPFILFTGKGSEEVASEAISAGVTDYLQKGTGRDQFAILANRIQNAVAQYRRERELAVTRRRYRAIFENPLSYVARLETDGTVANVNETAVELLEGDAAALEGEPFWEMPWWGGDSDHREYVREGIQRAADGESVRAQARFEADDGETVRLDGVLYPVYEATGEVRSIMAIGRDVSDLRET